MNRVLFPYLLDAAELFESGMEGERIDGALVKWGMPMGPLRLIDEIGVDITIDIGNTLEKAYGHAITFQLSCSGCATSRCWAVKRAQVSTNTKAKGRRLTTRWFDGARCSRGRRHRQGEGSAKSQQASSPSATAEELTYRLIFLMVNEAARCVEEGVVTSSEDADYGMILGTGFAPFRGGPLRFAEHFGLKRTVEELERLSRTEQKFTPCEILKKHARDGTKFYE